MTLSIAGHPVVLMAVAALVASPSQMGPTALAICLACAGAVLGYSYYKTKRGDWGHIDASAPTERGELNVRVGIGLLAVAGALWFAGVPLGFPLVAGLAALIVAAGHLFRSVAKLSLHVAFAVFSAILIWPNHFAVGALALVAVAVAWSRLVLRRHVPADLLFGALAGGAAGLVFHRAVAWLGA